MTDWGKSVSRWVKAMSASSRAWTWATTTWTVPVQEREMAVSSPFFTVRVTSPPVRVRAWLRTSGAMA